jgi:DNA invertase Pin-like site-specific DNA recombinase
MTSTSKPKRVAIYARVSTAHDQNPEMQVHALRQLAEQRGWEVVAQYVDVGVSGSKDKRPELDRLMKHVNRGGVDIVVCWRFDRFARSVRHLVLALEEFRAKGVDFVSMEDSIDTSTPAGRFVFHIVAAVAELERELIRERTRCGVAAARRRGARIGRPRVRVDVDRVVELRGAGMSVRDIAAAIKVGVGTVHRLLHVQQSTGCGTPITGPEMA